MSFINNMLYNFVINKGNNIEGIQNKIQKTSETTIELKRLMNELFDSREKEKKLISIIDGKNKFIEKIIKTHPGVLYVYNVKDNKNSWTNKEIINVLGYTQKEILDFGKDLFKNMMNKDDYKYYLDKIYPKYKDLKDEDIIENEYRFYNKNGEERWFKIIETVFNRDDNNEVVEILGVMIDIDKIKKDSELLRLNTNVLKYAKDSIVITNKLGNIIFANDNFCKTCEYKLEELIGQNPRIIKSDKHDNRFYEQLWKTISSGKTWNGIIINKSKSGKLFTEETTITPVANGEIQY